MSEEREEAFVKKVLTRTRREIHFYLGNNVTSDILDYADMLATLETAAASDKVVVHLSNFGGACHAGFTIAQAIERCAAHVTMRAEAPCYSMGAILALVGNKLEMSIGSFLMFHNYSGGFQGKGGETMMQMEEYNKHFKAVLEHYGCPFLTKREVKMLMDDKDVYVHSTDDNLDSRMERHFK